LSSALTTRWNNIEKTGSPTSNFKNLRIQHDLNIFPCVVTPGMNKRPYEKWREI
jgi:hypothetical protein